MGDFDEREFERREKHLSEIKYNSETQPNEYRGKFTFETEDSTEDLLEQLKHMKVKKKKDD